MDKQCPSCGGFCKKSGCERENVATNDTSKAWVGLHTTTILDIYTETLRTHRGGPMPDGQIAFAKAIEQALKERNTCI